MHPLISILVSILIVILIYNAIPIIIHSSYIIPNWCKISTHIIDATEGNSWTNYLPAIFITLLVILALTIPLALKIHKSFRLRRAKTTISTGCITKEDLDAFLNGVKEYNNYSYNVATESIVNQIPSIFSLPYNKDECEISRHEFEIGMMIMIHEATEEL
jgi:hypothetical protein